jgi:hypothetical protein
MRLDVSVIGHYVRRLLCHGAVWHFVPVVRPGTTTHGHLRRTTVPPKSGECATDVAEACRIEHLGSAHDESEVEQSCGPAAARGGQCRTGLDMTAAFDGKTKTAQDLWS